MGWRVVSDEAEQPKYHLADDEDGGPDSFLNPGMFKPTPRAPTRQLANTGPMEQVRRELDPQQYRTPGERVKRGFSEMPGALFAPFKSSLDVAPSEAEIQQGIDFTKKHGRPMDPMEADPMAQSVALTALLGPFGRLAATKLAPTVGAVPASAGVGAAEAYLGAKSAGAENAGDAAMFGGLFSGIGARGAGPNAAAFEKNNAQMVKDVKRGATKAPKAMADDVDFRADQLIDTSTETPEIRRALVTKARSNPAAAESAVQGSLDADVAANNATFDAIHQHHGAFDLNLVNNRLAALEARLYQEGHTVASEATGRILDRLNKQYGGNAGSTLTAEQLRNIRNDLGDIAFPGVAAEARPNAARGALGEVYGELNSAIEEVAGTVPGVDVSALRGRNRRITSLMPAQKALSERAALEADRELGLLGTAKDKLKKGATGLNRRLRYDAELHGGDNPTLMGAPAAGIPYETFQEIDPTDRLPPSALAAQLLMNGGRR